ncbi:Trichome birefringence [Zostera marina]|uniref:Trichome birefringence n=1 Tax=Zostera marina TaxID=29655 RepID=A0A0K9PC02_ZOSMR|nr:Trichome birefringence [Zostera marina]
MEFSKAIFQVFDLKTMIYGVILLFIVIDVFSSTSITKDPVTIQSNAISSPPHSLAIILKPSNTSFSSIPNLKNTTSVRKRPICDIFQGRWVVDDGRSRPSYPPGKCSFIDFNFDCFKSGRVDLNYTMLRWKPNGCRLRRLTRRKMARFLRGKRLAFVGDSLSKNEYQSFLCLLTNDAAKKKKVLVVKKSNVFQNFGFESANFPDDNFTVDFIRTPFLVQKFGGKVQLDMMAKVSEDYKNADIIVFNSAHWWRHRITNHGYIYQIGKHIYKHLSPKTAFKKSLRTWSKWVDANINATRTQVFFRSFSPVHYSGGQWNSGGNCRGENFPITKLKERGKFELQETLETALRKMSTPVRYLNVTTMSNYRKDAHPSIFRGKTVNETIQDCGHWCLPGVPDSWNELLFTMLMDHGQQK